MFSDIAFIIGLVLLFKGQFRIAQRTVPRSRGRLIGLILMSPVLVSICVGAALVWNDPNFDPEKIPGLEALYQTLEPAIWLGLVALIAALSAVIYLIYSLPKGQPETKDTAKPAIQPPDIMTVAEVAAYLRVTEADVMNLINDSKLPAARIGGSYRIARIAVQDFLNQQT